MINMANKKKDEKQSDLKGDSKLGELVEKFEKEFRKEMAGRPYLLSVTSGYVIGNEGDKATLAAQWSWRSNVIIGTQDSEKMMEFLTAQLKDVVDHPEYGVKKKYRK
jgi:hypothetical protein